MIFGLVTSCVFFFKQKTAYEMRISDWSSDVCSSDLNLEEIGEIGRVRDFDRKKLRHRFVASQGNALVAAGVAQEFEPIHEHRVARQRALAVRSLDVGIGKVDEQSTIVVEDHGIEQQRRLAPEPQLELRQIAGVAEEEPLRAPGGHPSPEGRRVGKGGVSQ